MQSGNKWFVVGLAMLASGASQAALFDRGGGMIYDSTLNVTWLADMNYAKTSGYDADGKMTWGAANTWAANLVFGGFNDWRLPTLNPSDPSCDSSTFGVSDGFGCTGGELSHLFVVDLGNSPFSSISSQVGDTPQQIANFAMFTNVRDDIYWSGTQTLPPAAAGRTLIFSTQVGIQDHGVASNRDQLLAVAVRSGDILASVPEPGSAALLCAVGAVASLIRRSPKPES